MQALGGPDRFPAVPSASPPSVSQDVRAPFVEQAGSAFTAQPSAAPGTAQQPSEASAHRPPPAGFAVPTFQPSPSGWVPSGSTPSLSAPESRSASESEDCAAGCRVSSLGSATSRLANLLYAVCPDSHPVAAADHPPRCGFGAWFSQP